MYRLKLEFRSAVTVTLSPHALQVLESLMMHTNNMTYLQFIDPTAGAAGIYYSSYILLSSSLLVA